jgi:hypothetical protein
MEVEAAPESLDHRYHPRCSSPCEFSFLALIFAWSDFFNSPVTPLAFSTFESDEGRDGGRLEYHTEGDHVGDGHTIEGADNEAPGEPR